MDDYKYENFKKVFMKFSFDMIIFLSGIRQFKSYSLMIS